MNFATFILSTGRCGTQWIAASLNEVYQDCIKVEHEPIHNDYAPRKALVYGMLPESPLIKTPTVAAHLTDIENQLETRPYIECGHPSWSTIPILANHFKDRFRVIHLTRHPVTSCYSWLTHGAFQTPLLPHLPEKILLSPFDEGIKFKEYQKNWPHLSSFEKCLFYWIEVHTFANDTHSRLSIPWLQLRYEDLFTGNGLGQLLEFLNLPERPGIFDLKGEVIDNYRSLTKDQSDWQVIGKHPRALEIAQKLGYGLEKIKEQALHRRYLGLTPTNTNTKQPSR